MGFLDSWLPKKESVVQKPIQMPVVAQPTEHEKIQKQLRELTDKVTALNGKVTKLLDNKVSQPLTPQVPSVTPVTGGYRATKKDKAALKKLKQGKSIGFTMRSSLKAKGLLRRANGTYRVSQKYRKN
jgi:uncharacterized coiled-coil protein SlyX